MDNNIEILDKIHKDADMGMNAIKYIMDKAQDNTFKEVLNTEHSKYKDIYSRIGVIFNKYKPTETPEKENPMTKMMTWSGIQMNTLTDHSNSKIAEIMIQGTNMGIISGRKLLNHNDLPNDIKNVLNDFVVMQEESVETLKKYL